MLYLNDDVPIKYQVIYSIERETERKRLEKKKLSTHTHKKFYVKCCRRLNEVKYTQRNRKRD